jgi:hypothetical protein
MREEVREALRVLRESGPSSLSDEVDVLEAEAERAEQLAIEVEAAKALAVEVVAAYRQSVAEHKKTTASMAARLETLRALGVVPR